MDFKAQSLAQPDLSSVAADALMLVLRAPALPKQGGTAIAAALKAAVEAGDLKLEEGHSLYLHQVAGVKAKRVVAVVAGNSGAKSVHKAVSEGLGLIRDGGARELAVALLDTAPGAAQAEAIALACTEVAYVYRLTKPSAPESPKLETVKLLCSKADSAAVASGLKTGKGIAEGVALARELANRPANHCTPTVLAAEAKRLAKEHRLKVDVLDRKNAAKLGMGAFLAVAQGSAEPPKLIVLRYVGDGKAPPTVLVGKGITFDTGGISIKPAAEMDEMKFDMGGAASVIGTFRALAELKPKINVVGIVPACENMPGGRAVKPGDVVRSLSGQTIEILNTDAEGRLILCDALTYAERFKPSAVVDVATLTGACVIALGHHRSGLFSPDDALAAELLAAGERALDPAWRMPVDDEYDEVLKSNFADMANVGPRPGGAITAAKFLQRYTKNLRWAHLDVAGTAWRSGKKKGATGRPVPLLAHFLLARARARGPHA
jgi:leucyl aminopeptidase